MRNSMHQHLHLPNMQHPCNASISPILICVHTPKHERFCETLYREFVVSWATSSAESTSEAAGTPHSSALRAQYDIIVNADDSCFRQSRQLRMELQSSSTIFQKPLRCMSLTSYYYRMCTDSLGSFSPGTPKAASCAVTAAAPGALLMPGVLLLLLLLMFQPMT